MFAFGSLPGAKNYWADCEKVWFFLNLIFMSVRILSFNAIHSVIKKIIIIFYDFLTITVTRWTDCNRIKVHKESLI
jgi:hypothetical protein